MRYNIQKCLALLVFAISCMPAFSGQGSGETNAYLIDLDQQWAKAINEGDSEFVVSIFASNAEIFGDGFPLLQGESGVRKFMDTIASIEGLSFRTSVSGVDLSESQDIALVRGTYQLSYPVDSDGTYMDSGDYVVVWRQIDGRWKVAFDVFKSAKQYSGKCKEDCADER